MPSDLEIAQSVTPQPITDIASDLGLSPYDLELYGRYKAKIASSTVNRVLTNPELSRGKLVVVTAITPTPAGEGKTTVAIGLTQALCRLNKRAIAAIREPSMGPVFGMKGGATGGGYAQVLPMDEINLHFTGDMHAITSANNLLAALIDNHMHQGNELRIDPETIRFKRCLDMNDRSLRQVTTGLGGKSNGTPRETGFQISVASEVMAILCLADDLADLRRRLSAIVIGLDTAGKPITAHNLNAVGAMMALLRDAIKPNLVQTLEHTPAFVHGGPFGNIANGCSSVIATKLALKLGEIVVTEAGFGSDLGFEKFCDIVAAPRMPDLNPDCVVLVATVRALKMHGGVSKSDLNIENVEAVKRGLPNLARHIAIVGQIGVPIVVTINRFAYDTDAEITAMMEYCKSQDVVVTVNDVWGAGGAGGKELGEAVIKALEKQSNFQPIYDSTLSIAAKLETLAQKVYGASNVEYTADAVDQRDWLEKNGYGALPVCVAKTQYSFTDNPKRRGAPTDFTLTVRELNLSAGAGFVVALMGDIMTMPGLPKNPAADGIDLDGDGRIVGLF